MTLPERVTRLWPPLRARHWCIGTKCVVCGEVFVEGDATCGVNAGDASGRNVSVAVAHARCTTAPAVEP